MSFSICLKQYLQYRLLQFPWITLWEVSNKKENSIWTATDSSWELDPPDEVWLNVLTMVHISVPANTKDRHSPAYANRNSSSRSRYNPWSNSTNCMHPSSYMHSTTTQFKAVKDFFNFLLQNEWLWHIMKSTWFQHRVGIWICTWGCPKYFITLCFWPGMNDSFNTTLYFWPGMNSCGMNDRYNHSPR
jgi:hypothetical protein